MASTLLCFCVFWITCQCKTSSLYFSVFRIAILICLCVLSSLCSFLFLMNLNLFSSYDGRPKFFYSSKSGEKNNKLRIACSPIIPSWNLSHTSSQGFIESGKGSPNCCIPAVCGYQGLSFVSRDGWERLARPKLQDIQKLTQERSCRFQNSESWHGSFFLIFKIQVNQKETWRNHYSGIEALTNLLFWLGTALNMIEDMTQLFFFFL